MRRTAQLACLAVLLVGHLTMLAGCGGGGSQNSVSTSGTPVGSAQINALESYDNALAQALLADPGRAVRIAPTAHHDPLLQSSQQGATTVPVATLQSDYETLFCGLSSRLNVTLTTPESVDKINFIKSQKETGYFDLLANPISNNALGVTAVSFQPVNYQTTVTLPAGPQTFQVSGGLLMPEGIDKSKIKGMVVYFHGTTFNKAVVPSNYSDSVEAQLSAELFASQGYVVALPDYIGQGVDWQHVHPYVVYPTVSAKTAVDMLAAVKPIVAAHYGYDNADPPMKLFSTGYSEGGAYSLWFNTFIRSTPGVLDPFFALTHSVGMEGAYSTSVVTEGYLFDRVGKAQGNPYHIQHQVLVNMCKPMFGADALLGYATYTLGGDYAKTFNTEYYQMNASLPLVPDAQSLCNVNGQHVDIAQAFGLPDTDCSAPLFFAALNKWANATRYMSLVEFPFSSENSGYALVSRDLAVGPGRWQLDQVLRAADVNLSSGPDAGVSIITLTEDSLVVPNNYDYVRTTYPTKIDMAVKIAPDNLMVVSPVLSVNQAVFVPVDHSLALIYEFLYSLHAFDSHQ